MGERQKIPRRLADCKTDDEVEAYRAFNRERAKTYRERQKAKKAGDPGPADTPDIDIEVESDGVTPITVCACPYCGTQIEIGENTCHDCGQPIAWPELAESDDWVVCDQCGAAEKVGTFAGSCRRCGYSG